MTNAQVADQPERPARSPRPGAAPSPESVAAADRQRRRHRQGQRSGPGRGPPPRSAVPTVADPDARQQAQRSRPSGQRRSVTSSTDHRRRPARPTSSAQAGIRRADNNGSAWSGPASRTRQRADHPAQQEAEGRVGLRRRPGRQDRAARTPTRGRTPAATAPRSSPGSPRAAPSPSSTRWTICVPTATRKNSPFERMPIATYQGSVRARKSGQPDLQRSRRQQAVGPPHHQETRPDGADEGRADRALGQDVASARRDPERRPPASSKRDRPAPRGRPGRRRSAERASRRWSPASTR